ncbi:MAG: two-CW domain-containing protein [Thermodesulfobacteriota bacterium]
MGKRNCWQEMGCGREPGGARVRELGVCPAAVESRLSGVNDGLNGGRCCWAITGTLCGGEVQGTFAHKVGGCLLCPFYIRVRDEEGEAYVTTKEIIRRLKA